MENNTCFIKFTNGFHSRSEDYQISTKVVSDNGKKYVIKEPLTPKARAHIQAIHTNTQSLKLREPFIIPPSELREYSLISEYVEGNTVDHVVMENISDQEAFFKAIDRFLDLLWQVLDPYYIDKSTDEFNQYFGHRIEFPMEYCRFNNFDLLFSNIVIHDDKLYLIDNEWIFSFPIPFKYIEYRVLCALYSGNKSKMDSEGIGIDALLEYYRLLQFKDLFSELENVFLSKVYDKQNNIINALNNGFQNVSSTLYIDRGNGFNEKDKLISFPSISKENGNEYRVFNFNLPSNAINLRWDPIEGEYIICSIVSITDSFTAYPVNSIKTELGDLFYSDDPQYILNGEFQSVKCLVIKALVIHNTERMMIDTLHKSSAVLSQKEENIEHLNQIIEENKRLIEMQETALSNMDKHIKAIEETNHVQAEKISVQSEQINNLQIKINEIYLSRSWKFICAIKRFTNFFRK